MRRKLGMGLAAAGMLAFAGSAQATDVDYTGLVFNAQSPNFFLFTTIFDETWSPRTDFDAAGSPADALGQAVYTLSYDGAGTVAGTDLATDNGVINFEEGTKDLTFGGGAYRAQIVDGYFRIDRPSNFVSEPGIKLPYDLSDDDGVHPDYELEDGTLTLRFWGADDEDHTGSFYDMTFSLCERLSGSYCDTTSSDDRPRGTDEPYNTLNVGNDHSDTVGNGDGENDLAMFALMKGDCSNSLCPFFVEAEDDTYQRWQVTGTTTEQVCYHPYGGGGVSSYPDRCEDSDWLDEGYHYVNVEVDTYDWVDSDTPCGTRRSDFRMENQDGTFSGGSQATTMLGTGGGGGPRPNDCRKIRGHDGDSDLILKIALWGTGETSTDTPEPAALSLLGLGLLGMGAVVRRRRKAA